MKLLTFFALTFMASWSLWFAAARLSGADAGFVSLSAGLRALAGVWPPFGNTPWYLLIIATAFSTPVQAGEEIGWRGFALPQLSAAFGLPVASILLGVIWACWHLPLFFPPIGDNTGQSFPVYVAAVTGISVALAWLYWRTKGSLLLTMLMHAATNNMAGIAHSQPVVGANPFTVRPTLVSCLTATFVWVPATYFLVTMRSTRRLE